MTYIYDDGGRAAAGYADKVGDCSVRAIAIATETNYRQVYDCLVGAPGNGYLTQRWDAFLRRAGWRKVVPPINPMRPDELPGGRLIVHLAGDKSGHLVAVIDGVPHDTYDPWARGRRQVLGYWHRRDVRALPARRSHHCWLG